MRCSVNCRLWNYAVQNWELLNGWKIASRYPFDSSLGYQLSIFYAKNVSMLETKLKTSVRLAPYLIANPEPVYPGSHRRGRRFVCFLPSSFLFYPCLVCYSPPCLRPCISRRTGFYSMVIIRYWINGALSHVCSHTDLGVWGRIPRHMAPHNTESL